MLTIGTISESRTSGFDYAVSIGDVLWPVKNPEVLGRTIVCEGEDDNIGRPVLVRYEPQDQFCEVILMDKVERALAMLDKEKDLKVLLDYVEQDEEQHCDEYVANGGKKEDHIYATILRLK